MNEGGGGLVVMTLGFLVFMAVVSIFGDDTTDRMKECISAGYEWKSGDCVKAGEK